MLSFKQTSQLNAINILYAEYIYIYAIRYVQKSYKERFKCDPCWQNESECAWANFELQTKKSEKFRFWLNLGFHKNELIKPLSGNPHAPNSN